MLLPYLTAAVLGYLLGSLPFGYLVARARGVNIFEVGSRNPGATNVHRTLGRGPGNLVLVLDTVKGAAATYLAGSVLRFFPFTGAAAPETARPDEFAIVGLLAALFGHGYSCFTRFQGGKGVATGAGGFLVVFPLGGLIAAGIWTVSAALTRYVSVASMVAAASLPLTALLLERPPLLVWVSVTVAIFVIARHRPNIARLWAGTETRIGRKAVNPDS